MLRVVIAGGPCSGKTKIVRLLEKRGYFVIRESATEIIKEQKATGGSLLPDKKPFEFQTECLRRQLANEKKIPENTKIVVYEVSTVDSFAYARYWGILLPKEMTEIADKIRYDIVFLMELLSFFEHNGIRFGDSKTAKNIHRIIRETYEHMGYKPISVPPVEPEKRMKMIEDILKRYST